MMRQAWIEERKTQWLFGVQNPTVWFEWLQTDNLASLQTHSLNELPQAGIAGEGWHLAALSEKGKPLGLLDLVIELNEMSALRLLIDALNWQSSIVCLQAGELASRCFLMASSPSNKDEALLSAAALLLANGALLPNWQTVANHFLWCQLPLDAVELPDESKASIFPLDPFVYLPIPVPMALVMDENMGKDRESAFSQWVSKNPLSLGSCRIKDAQGGQTHGAGILHACVWAKDNRLLQLALRAGINDWLVQQDGRDRTPALLAEALEAFDLQKEFHSYNARAAAQAALNDLFKEPSP